jgi:pyrroline-5-carboxylate reductase
MAIKFAMIGGGVMGEALLSRLLDRNLYLSSDVLVSEPQPERQAFLAQRYGVQVTDDNRQTFQATDVILLAIKPQVLPQVAAQLAGLSSPLTQPPILASILAGTSLHQLETAFPGLPIVRAMPNTPATVGAGITAIAGGQRTQPHHLELAQRIFQAVGEVLTVPEAQMDAVTGLSGSGPGFVAIMIEALTDGGVAAGLPRPVAARLALQTVRGTAQLLQETGLHPAELKDRVTSPGGTTIAGIAQLEQAGFRSAVIAAVQTAYQRSQQLGQA